MPRACCVRRLAEFVDFVVCLGGDGVILHASALFKHSIPPVGAAGASGHATSHIGWLAACLLQAVQIWGLSW